MLKKMDFWKPLLELFDYLHGFEAIRKPGGVKISAMRGGY
jgi:hypothetical protein